MFKTITINPLALLIPRDGDPPQDPPPVEFTPEQQALLDAKIAEVTEGLRKTNQDLKTEKTEAKNALTSMMESVGGEDGLKALKALQERFASDETNKLLAEGKHDEWFETKVGPLREQYDAQISSITTERDEAFGARDAALSQLSDKVLQVDVSMAATEAKVLSEPGVLRDITRAAREVFKWSDEHQALVREKDGVIVLGKDAKNPQTVAEWLSLQKDESRHWWGASAGGGSKGSKGRLANGEANPWSKEGWNLTAQGQFVREHGIQRANEAAASVGSKVGATSASA